MTASIEPFSRATYSVCAHAWWTFGWTKALPVALGRIHLVRVTAIKGNMLRMQMLTAYLCDSFRALSSHSTVLWIGVPISGHAHFPHALAAGPRPENNNREKQSAWERRNLCLRIVQAMCSRCTCLRTWFRKQMRQWTTRDDGSFLLGIRDRGNQMQVRAAPSPFPYDKFRASHRLYVRYSY